MLNQVQRQGWPEGRPRGHATEADMNVPLQVDSSEEGNEPRPTPQHGSHPTIRFWRRASGGRSRVLDGSERG
jgi:hypothetical protein